MTKKPLQDAYRQRIYRPLGLRDTCMEWFEPFPKDRLSHNFFREDGGKNWDLMATGLNVSGDWAVGGQVSTVDDQNKFIRGLFAGRLFQNPQTLSSMMDAKGKVNHNLHYGFGLYRVRTPSGPECYGHFGASGLGTFFFPREGVSLVFMVNQGQNDLIKRLEEITEALTQSGLLQPGTAARAGEPAPLDLKKEKMVIRRGVPVPMRDRVNLATDLFLPLGPGPFPAVLLRTPYTAALGQLSQGINVAVLDWAREFTSQGYVFVMQDCRGTGRSEGDWKPFALEKDDGIDLIRWVQKQRWCNGQIATFGGSYCGYTQLISAPHVQEAISTMLLDVPAFDWYWCNFIGGAYRLELMTAFDAAMARPLASDTSLLDHFWNY